MRWFLLLLLLLLVLPAGLEAHPRTCAILRRVYGRLRRCSSRGVASSSSFTVSCLGVPACTIQVELWEPRRLRKRRRKRTPHKRGVTHYPTPAPSPQNSDPHCARGHRVDISTCCPLYQVTCGAPTRLCNESLAPCDLHVTQTLYIYYDPEMGRSLGKHLPQTLQLAVQDANRVYRNSLIPITLRLLGHAVHPTLSDYHDSYRLLADFRGSDRRGANFAVFLSTQIQSCGRGYYDCMGFPDPQTCPYAVVRLSCVFGMYSMMHELGHIAGADHDVGFKSVAKSRFPDNYGLTLPGGERTIMSISMYGGTSRVPYYSTPLASWDGEPLGVRGEADNARVISYTRYEISQL